MGRSCPAKASPRTRCFENCADAWSAGLRLCFQAIHFKAATSRRGIVGRSLLGRRGSGTGGISWRRYPAAAITVVSSPREVPRQVISMVGSSRRSASAVAINGEVGLPCRHRPSTRATPSLHPPDASVVPFLQSGSVLGGVDEDKARDGAKRWLGVHRDDPSAAAIASSPAAREALMRTTSPTHRRGRSQSMAASL